MVHTLMAIILIAYSQGLKLWVAPGRLVANAVAIIHSNCALCTIWLCHCCVLYPGYVSPRCSLVPKQGCMVWEHYFSAISGLEMASEAILGHLIFLGWGGGGGGGACPQIPLAGACSASTLPLQLG